MSDQFWIERLSAQLALQNLAWALSAADEQTEALIPILEGSAKHGTPIAWDANTTRLLADVVDSVPSDYVIDRKIVPAPRLFVTFAEAITALNITGFGLMMIDAEARLVGPEEAKTLAILVLTKDPTSAPGWVRPLSDYFPTNILSIDFDRPAYLQGDLDVTIYTAVKAVIAMLEFANDRLLMRSHERAPRSFRRQRERDGQPDELLTTVISLRRVQHQARDAEADDAVDWSCRWIVRGHWRQQWCPSTSSHRSKWISSYVKGPDDKPLKNPGVSVFAVSR